MSQPRTGSGFWKIFFSFGYRLGLVPPLFWFFFYLLVVFLFAHLYSQFPKGFYHATSQYEKILELDKKMIENELSYLLRFKLRNKSFVNSYYLKSIEVKLSKFFTDSFQFAIFYQYFEDQNKTRLIFIDHEFTHPQGDVFTADFSYNGAKGPVYFFNHDSYSFFEFFYQDYSIVLGKRNERKFDNLSKVSGFHMQFSKELELKLFNYSEALNGFPQNSSGNFERMFYLSAVTITTLGYGDIVPILPITRVLIWLEATFGVFIVGLFFNSLANQINLNRQDQL